MEFDKSKVYTALNADELKVGSKVILSDSIDCLRTYVKANDSPIDTVESIKGEECEKRFFDGTFSWNLAYLVEEPEEPEGLKWTDLKVGDVIMSPSMVDYMVTGIDRRDTECCHIWANGWISDEKLKEWEKVEE